MSAPLPIRVARAPKRCATMARADALSVANMPASSSMGSLKRKWILRCLRRLFEAGAAEDRVEAHLSDVDETIGHQAAHEREADVASVSKSKVGMPAAPAIAKLTTSSCRRKHVSGPHWRLSSELQQLRRYPKALSSQTDEDLTVLDCDRGAGRLERLVLVVEHERNRAALVRDHHEPREVLGTSNG